MNIKKITLACMLASLNSTSFAAPVVPPSAPATVTSCTNGVNCQELINTNTGNNQIFTFNIFDYMTNQFGFGLADFDLNQVYKTQHPSGGSIITNNIVTANQTVNDFIIESTYLAGRFFIRNLPVTLYGFSNASNIFTISHDNRLNDINKTQIDGITGYANNDGINPIKNLDVKPFNYPRSSQLIRNSLASVSPVLFLNALQNLGSTAESSVSSDIFKATKNLCVATAVDADNNNTNFANASSENSCLQPFVQLNTISGGYSNTNSSAFSYNPQMPGYWTFLRETTASEVLPSLNANTLLSPLTYNEENTTGNDNSARLGLYGRTELASADNFIRYLSGELIPNTISTDTEYQKYMDIANSTDDTYTCGQYPIDAAMKLKVYRTMLRGYAAQESVGTSNLYHLMQKRRRVPTNDTDVDDDTNTSQMEEEYNMATYRIFNPNGYKETEWQANLKKASSAGIQKQMAMLLAEINYQLFLNRKEQERILLTLSAMQLGQNAQQKKQLTLSQASTFVSPIQTNTITPETKCQLWPSSQ